MKKDTSIEVFGLAFLDLISCGLGGSLILMLLFSTMIGNPVVKANKEAEPEVVAGQAPNFDIVIEAVPFYITTSVKIAFASISNPTIAGNLKGLKESEKTRMGGSPTPNGRSSIDLVPEKYRQVFSRNELQGATGLTLQPGVLSQTHPQDALVSELLTHASEDHQKPALNQEINALLDLSDGNWPASWNTFLKELSGRCGKASINQTLSKVASLNGNHLLLEGLTRYEVRLFSERGVVRQVLWSQRPVELLLSNVDTKPTFTMVIK